MITMIIERNVTDSRDVGESWHIISLNAIWQHQRQSPNLRHSATMIKRWRLKSGSSDIGKNMEEVKAEMAHSKRDRFSFERYYSNNTDLGDMSSQFTRMVLGATPENTYDRPKWENVDIFDILQVHLEDYSIADESLFPGLPALEDFYPEIHNILTSEVHGSSAQAARLWKPCLDVLKHAVEMQSQAIDNNPRYKSPTNPESEHISSLKKHHRHHPNGIGDFVEINRPLTVTFLQAICAQFVDCLAFEALRYTWKTEKYAFRRIRIGPNNGERIRVELREDVCWRARKQRTCSEPSRDVPAKKIGIGPLFAVLIKNPEEFADLRLSALADLKPLLTILQDRRREAAYTTTDDISSSDQIYSSFIVSVSSSILGYVSINTLTASGYYLAAIENGDPPPRGEKLLYRRGQNLDLCSPLGRVEFARIMLGLLNKVCERKVALDDTEPPENGVTECPKPKTTWGRVRKQSRLKFSLLSKDATRTCWTLNKA